MTKIFRVLISDSMSSQAEDILKASTAIEVDVKADISPEELLSCIGQYDGLLVRSRTKVTKEVLAVASKLKVIGRAGIGVDNIDVEAASKLDIIVENAPLGNTRTTAEHAICLLLSLLRNIPMATATMKKNTWEKKKLQGTEMFGKNFGVIGLGNIGKIVAELGLGLSMKVLGHDPFLSPEAGKAMGVELVTMDDLLERSDFISVHTPLNDKTRGLIGASEFDRMKRGAFLVHAARGGIVNEEACLAALNSGQLSGAAFDVFEQEPPSNDHPLVMHERCISSPHLGASTAQAQINVAVCVAEQMILFAETGELRNAVNLSSNK